VTDDEMVEVTPKSLRLRKKILQANRRPKKSALPAGVTVE
jgi:GTP-binding protein